MNKTVLITGVNGGMGIASAKLFSSCGYTVIGVDISDTCELPIIYYKTDLTKYSEIENTFEKVKGQTEKIDIIIHFAGIYRMDSLVEMEEKEFEKIFDVNLFSIYRVNKIFLPLMKDGSKIIITSSELAPLYPLPFTGIYAVTKSAIEKYAYSLKMELQLLGIDVSVIRPGAVKTELLDVSVSQLDRLCNKTELYKYNTKRFKKIVDSVESRHVNPDKIAKLAKKIADKKRVKFVYSINRNPLLILLNSLPKSLQLFVIKKILNNSNGK